MLGTSLCSGPRYHCPGRREDRLKRDICVLLLATRLLKQSVPEELECPQESRRVEEKAVALVPVGGESSSQEAIAHSSPSYQTILQEILESKQ